MIIRPATGTGNKVIVQDQAGAAVLTTADSGATIASTTLNSPTLVTPVLGTPASGTLTNCTFPSTHPKLTITKQNWQGDTTGTTETVVANYYGWQNTKASSTVFIEMTFNGEVKRESGTISERYAHWHMYYSTSNVSDGATSNFGTELGRCWLGRNEISSSGADASSWGVLHITGKFTASSAGTQYYFGLTSDADNGNTRHETYGESSLRDGTLIKIWEY